MFQCRKSPTHCSKGHASNSRMTDADVSARDIFSDEEAFVAASETESPLPPGATVAAWSGFRTRTEDASVSMKRRSPRIALVVITFFRA